MLNVAVIEKSRFLRLNLTIVIEQLEGIDSVKAFSNPKVALNYIQNNDISLAFLGRSLQQTPDMNVLSTIASKYRIPVILVMLGDSKDPITNCFRALCNGAVDIIKIPRNCDSLFLYNFRKPLQDKVDAAINLKTTPTSLTNKIAGIEKGQVSALKHKRLRSGANISAKLNIEKKNPRSKFWVEDQSSITPDFSLVIIGASTGGPELIYSLLKRTAGCKKCSILVAQHMPPNFIDHFVKRLNKVSAFPVEKASHNAVILPRHVYLAPAGKELKLKNRNNEICFKIQPASRRTKILPNIDCIMSHAAQIFKQRCIGIILSGMGSDGSIGISKIKHYGGITVAQDVEEALINSMPSNAILTGTIDYVTKIQEIPYIINQVVKV